MSDDNERGLQVSDVDRILGALEESKTTHGKQLEGLTRAHDALGQEVVRLNVSFDVMKSDVEALKGDVKMMSEQGCSRLKDLTAHVNALPKTTNGKWSAKKKAAVASGGAGVVAAIAVAIAKALEAYFKQAGG